VPSLSIRTARRHAVAAVVALSLQAATSVSGQVIWPDQSRELSPEDRSRLDALRRSQAEADAKERAEMKALREKLLRAAPLPPERNVLLGRWRLEGNGKPRPRTDNEMFKALLTDTENFLGGAACELMFGSGIEFKPTTYASGGVAGLAEGPIAYRTGAPQHIVAIPADKRTNFMVFAIADPNRIMHGESCTLVRVGTASPAVQGRSSNRAPAPSSEGHPPTMAGAAPAPPPATLSRPSPQVCRNTLLDKLGVVGVNQVRAMSDVRFKEAGIEGKVPNTGNLRIDLRGSACDDPRLKASLYDFDANGMLQSITYVWARPSGPAPSPIFTERVSILSRFHALPAPQTPGQLQADTSLGRLILQDVPERGLLLEAYAARR